MEKKTETVAHIISDQDPQKCWDKVAEFTKSKEREDFELHWNATPIIINPNGQSIIIPTCFILWHCTPEQKKSWINSQRILLKA